MAILFMESFDGIGSGADFSTKWTSGLNINAGDFASTFGRNGTWGASLDGESLSQGGLTPNPVTKGVAGMAIKCVSGDWGSGAHVFTLWNATDGSIGYPLRLGVNDSGFLYTSTYNGVVLATATTQSLNVGTWYYIEWKWFIDNTTGYSKARINGNATLPLDFSGDTQRGTAAWDRITFAGATSTTLYIDDIYVLDLTTEPTDWLGDCKVQYKKPNADGTYDAWTLSAGSDTYALLDDTDPDTDGTDYVTSGTVGSTVTVNIESLDAGTQVIHGIQLMASLTKTDAGAREVTGAVYTSASLYTASTPVAPPNGSYSYGRWIWATSPATSTAWTTSEIASLEVGCQVTT